VTAGINDCDGAVDEGYVSLQTSCGIGECARKGWTSCINGQEIDSCKPGLPTAEICDDKDNDCDGVQDDGVLLVFYQDLDHDGYGNPNASVLACTTPSGCVVNSNDCDDTTAAITQLTFYQDLDHDGYGNPNASVLACTTPSGCVVNSNDCDDTTAAITQLTFYQDLDSDGYGNPNKSVLACAAPSGYVANSNDCDDTTAVITQLTFYQDADGDGYGSRYVYALACTAPNGYVENNWDCNDSDAAMYPGAVEICDGKDNNCSGAADEGVQLTFYQDADADTFGNAAVTMLACTAPAGYVADASDCNDANAAINPAAVEVCDNVDNNCAGGIDEGYY